MKTEKDKENFFEAYRQSLGNISEACKNSNVKRATFYLWKKNDQDFLQKIEEIEEEQFDFVQSKLLEQIDYGNVQAIMFYLKTKGKSHGYTEEQQINVTNANDQPFQIEII